MDKIEILSVNISKERGTVKTPVDEINLNSLGVEGDAHRGNWGRMLSLLAIESHDKVKHLIKRKLKFGEFAENITTKGLLLSETNLLDILKNDNVELLVSQIGKEGLGDSLPIFKEIGFNIMPKEGIYTRVIKGGILKAGDFLEYHPKIHKIHVITLSDRAFKGEYEDRSGPAVEEQVKNFFANDNRKCDIQRTIIPDDPAALEALIAHSVNAAFDAIITTGGTGVGERDITPETVLPMLDKEVPGIMDMIRLKYAQKNPQVLLSRSIAGVTGKTQIYCLPGSVKACKEYLDEILIVYHHLLLMLYNIDAH